jgi:hypothetical protein
LPSLIAYHGTTSDRLNLILNNNFTNSIRKASWLGYGTYFFYDAPGHASNWAESVAIRRQASNPTVKPVVIEAEIDLGNCLNLLDSLYWPLVAASYASVPASVTQLAFGVAGPQAGFNYRDCAALNAIISAFIINGTPLDTIVAAFAEGTPIGPGSYLFDKSAVAICVQHPGLIRILRHWIV